MRMNLDGTGLEVFAKGVRNSVGFDWDTSTGELWFTDNGEGLHDASWQPDATLGPGSQNGPFASHGCVHVPLAAVTTLYQWAPIGTPVVVYPGDGASAMSQVAQQTVDAAGNPLGGPRGD